MFPVTNTMNYTIFTLGTLDGETCRDVAMYIPEPRATIRSGHARHISTANYEVDREDEEISARITVISPGISVLEPVTKADMEQAYPKKFVMKGPEKREESVMEAGLCKNRDEPGLPSQILTKFARGETVNHGDDEPLDLSIPKVKSVTAGIIPLPRQTDQVAGEVFITLDSYQAEENGTASDTLSQVGDITDQAAWGISAESAQQASSCPDYSTEDAPWETDSPSQDSSYSRRPGDPDPGRVVRAVRAEGVMLVPPPNWMLKRRGYSAHILNDGDLQLWSENDKKYCVSTRGEMSIKNWVRTLKGGEILIRGHSVVVYLKTLSSFETEGQVKNAVASLVRAIRAVKQEEVRVFISDRIVPIESRVLGLRTTKFNDLLFQCVRSLRISHNLSKVYYAGMAKYFDEKDVPAKERRNHKYLLEQGKLSQLGCIQFRAQLNRELGFAPFN